jgi:glutaminyl-peptide cyclotransferase
MNMKNISLLLVLLNLSACTNNNPQSNDNNTTLTIPAAVQLSFTILKIYPHDTSAFTQGLQYVNGFLYEGTGENGRSTLRKTELTTGKVLKRIDLAKEYFGEGITVLGNKIFQITWQNKKGFVYNLSDLKLIKEFTYNIDGWGLTNDGSHLIVSDGSNNVYYWDPENLKEIKRISVQDQTGLKNNLNELEFINGFVYANVWQTDEILKIDTATGNVVGKLDLSNLKKSYPELVDENNNKVLNGIAWDSSTKRIFITGKNWPKLFEIKLN